jgi:hypothetical protein
VCEAAVRASHPLDFEQRAWWASYNGDRATLDSLIEEPVDDPWQTVVALEYLRLTAPEESLRVDARYERLIASRPDDWRVIRPYVLGLRDRHLNTRARAAIRAWLGRPHRSEGAFDEVMARISYARSCLEDHLDHEGYEMIEPAVPSFQGSALATAVDLLDRLGRGGDAETLAVIAWQRYPDSPEAQVQAVDMLWRRGHGDVAAWMLKHAPQALRPDEWRRLLGPRYVSLAREQPSAARAAVAALVGMQLDDWPRLGGLVAALADSGRHEDAVSLMGRVRSGPLEDIAVESDRQEALAKIMFAYRNVKAARGTAAAADWLTAHLPDRSERTIPFLHYFAFINRDDEALWILPLVGDEFSRESLWLLRVAAMARDSAGTPAQRQELRARFATPSSNRYRHFARLLLGLESADDILSLPGEGKTPGEAFYYIALAAQARGDYHRAAVWYERCIDQNLWNNGEHHWALDQLSRWVGRNRSLERIAEADGWKGPSAPNGGPVAAVAR